MFLKFIYFTCCPHPFSFRTSLFTKRPYVQYIHTFNMFKHFNFGKHIWIHTSKIKKKYTHFKISCRDEVFTRLFFLFFIPGWNFIRVFLTGMSPSRDKISSREKRVNSKRHFIIDRDDFVRGRVSSQDEISRVNTL